MSEIVGWNGAGKWHLWHADHAACSVEILLSPSAIHRAREVDQNDLCRRCFPRPRRHLSLVRCPPKESSLSDPIRPVDNPRKGHPSMTQSPVDNSSAVQRKGHSDRPKGSLPSDPLRKDPP